MLKLTFIYKCFNFSMVVINSITLYIKNMDSSEKIIKRVKKFSKKHNICFKKNKFKVSELWSGGDDISRDSKWEKFEEKAGVYIFINQSNDYISEKAQKMWVTDYTIGF